MIITSDLLDSSGHVLAYTGEEVRVCPGVSASLVNFDILTFSPRRKVHRPGSIMVPRMDFERATAPQLSTDPIDSGPPRLLAGIATPAMRLGIL